MLERVQHEFDAVQAGEAKGCRSRTSLPWAGCAAVEQAACNADAEAK
jgi:hypothetical protein